MHDSRRGSVICTDKGLCQQPGSAVPVPSFARALSPLPACNSAQISEEAGRLIFSVCMAKERGHALTPGSQLFNPPPRPAEGKGKKNLSVLASRWRGEGRWSPGPPMSRSWALTASFVCGQGLGGSRKTQTFPSPQHSCPEEGVGLESQSDFCACLWRGSVHGCELLKYLRDDNCINTKTR